MCLYALKEYREWSLRLARPALLPFARRVCELISRNRLSLSRLFGHSETEIREKLSAVTEENCGGKCRVP